MNKDQLRLIAVAQLKVLLARAEAGLPIELASVERLKHVVEQIEMPEKTAVAA